MVNSDDITREKIKEHNPNWPPNSWSSIKNINNWMFVLDLENQMYYLI